MDYVLRKKRSCGFRPFDVAQEQSDGFMVVQVHMPGISEEGDQQPAVSRRQFMEQFSDVL
jgi:hypothetical protein